MTIKYNHKIIIKKKNTTNTGKQTSRVLLLATELLVIHKPIRVIN